MVSIKEIIFTITVIALIVLINAVNCGELSKCTKSEPKTVKVCQNQQEGNLNLDCAKEVLLTENPACEGSKIKLYQQKYKECLDKHPEVKKECPPTLNPSQFTKKCFEAALAALKTEHAAKHFPGAPCTHLKIIHDFLEKRKQVAASKNTCAQNDPNVAQVCKAAPEHPNCKNAIAKSAAQNCKQAAKMQSSELEIRKDIDDML